MMYIVFQMFESYERYFAGQKKYKAITYKITQKILINSHWVMDINIIEKCPQACIYD